MRTRTLVALAVLCLSLPLWSTAGEARVLSFDDRVRAQEAIERVYYGYQIGARLPFEQAVPRTVLEEKVRTYLRQSAALDQIWQTPVTAEMLGREMERMAAGTRMPARLRELFGALGNDPFMVQECLARPALVSRLVEARFAGDPSLHAEERGQAEQLQAKLAQGAMDPRAEHPRRELVDLPLLRPLDAAVGPVDETSTAFVVRARLASSSARPQAAVYTVPKRSMGEWWRSVSGTLDPDSVKAVASERAPLPTPSTGRGAALLEPADSRSSIAAAAPCNPDDTWDNGAFDDAVPDARAWHGAVWTGAVMVVWGGRDSIRPLRTGGRYDPSTDTWTPVSTTGAPSARYLPGVVWTGSSMLVWGGRDLAGLKGDGAAYDPWSDVWTPISSSGAPSARVNHTAAWSGSVMVVWGGDNGGTTTFADGATYDPVADSWVPMAGVGAPDSRTDHTAVYAELSEGAEPEPIVRPVLVVWGGRRYDTSSGQWTYLNSGGRYFLDTGVWLPTRVEGFTPGPGDPSPALLAAPSARGSHVAVWSVWTDSQGATQRQMVVWGGRGPAALNSGSMYDPSADVWTALPASGMPTARFNHRAVFASWMERISKPNNQFEDVEKRGLVVWGGEDGVSVLASGGRLIFDTSGPIWGPTSVDGQPAARTGHSLVSLGSTVVAWGGTDGTRYMNSGARYNPTRTAQPAGPANTWFTLRTAAAPRAGHSSVWTGSQLLVWGGRDADRTLNSGGRYDPAIDNWSSMTDVGAPSARDLHTAVWSGSQMIVWGGGANLASGGRYDPVTDRWSTLSASGAPSGRVSHTAVWTGSRMIVWGGNSTSPLNTGGRYDPTTDTWSAISTTGAPTARAYHTAVWTGSTMLVWGGAVVAVPLATGGRYDPGTNAWFPLSAVDAPQARSRHVAAWTGSKMIVWGGTDGAGTYFTDGKLYDPVSSTWTDLGLGGGSAPSGRIETAAAWTGADLVVWGGDDGATRLGDGARYNAAADAWTEMPVVPSWEPQPSPEARSRHGAVWTGTFFLVWGGVDSSGTYLSRGGRYSFGNAVDDDGDGWTECDGDCNDSSAAIRPRALETCNGLDDDCDGQVDEEGVTKSTFYRDVDSDGYGNSEKFVVACTAPVGYVPPPPANARYDCDDTNAAINSGMSEACNGIDDDCDGFVDDGDDVQTASYRDPDGDSLGNWNEVARGCYVPEGYVLVGGDNCPTTFNTCLAMSRCDSNPVLEANASVLPTCDTDGVMATCDTDGDGALSAVELAVGDCATLAKLETCDVTGPGDVPDGALSYAELSRGGQCSFIDALSPDELAVGDCATLARLSICDTTGPNGVPDGAISTLELRGSDECNFMNALSTEEVLVGDCATLAHLATCDTTGPDGIPDGALVAGELSGGGDCDLISVCDVDDNGILTDREIGQFLQRDGDEDGVGDACDICLTTADPGQGDYDGDGYGDGCELGALLADADLNGRADGGDLARMGRAWGTRSILVDENGQPIEDGDGNTIPNPDFDRTVDYTKDGIVDGEDLSILASVFGQYNGLPVSR